VRFTGIFRKGLAAFHKIEQAGATRCLKNQQSLRHDPPITQYGKRFYAELGIGTPALRPGNLWKSLSGDAGRMDTRMTRMTRMTRVWDAGYWILDTGYWILDIEDSNYL
jgi:hypothetical protein